MKKTLSSCALIATLFLTGCTTDGGEKTSGKDSPPPPPAPVPTLTLPDEYDVEEDEDMGTWGFKDDFSFSMEEGTLQEVKVYPKKRAEKDREKRAEATAEPTSTAEPTDSPTSAPEGTETAQAGGTINPADVSTPAAESTPTSSPEPTEEPVSYDFTEYEVEEDPSDDIDEKYFFDGNMNEDSTEWEDDKDILTPDTEYQWVVLTEDQDGETRTYADTVKTRELKDSEKGGFRSNVGDEQEVGVAAPIIITFNVKVEEEYRDDIERKLKVTNKDEKVEGSWGWLADDAEGSRLHYRTKEFWPEHTDVEAKLSLNNVQLTDEIWSTQSMSLDFSIGRKQEVVADAGSKRMKVYRDGKKIMDFPTSLGKPSAPSHNGTHIVMGKHRHYTMTSTNYGYSTPTEYAVRIHNNGEFIHGAPWSVGDQGVRNVSHGCINLSIPRAKEYYDTAMYGDPVEIENSNATLSKNASDVSDWQYSWKEWKALSALED